MINMENSTIKIKSGVLSLNPLPEKLGFHNAKHLLNRCLLGARKSEIDFFQDKTAEEALDFLLQESITQLSPPLGVKQSDLEVPVGSTWVNTKYNSKYKSERKYSYNNWWLGRLINQDISLKEKMVLFWHNHFVIENDVVSNINFNYKYNVLLNECALDNFKTLTEEMTLNVGMLKYLDGDENKLGSANENYARELFELFTIGKGPLIEEGNYTNYTEHDIREAAKVLTGWRTNGNTDQPYFTSSRHDKTQKTFSDIYEKFTISNKEEKEYKRLIQMIFLKKETARHLVRKLYRWFVYYQIDEQTEEQIINPLASFFIEQNFEIKPLLKKLLSSQHFFDENYLGSMIKNPLDFTVGLLRQLEFDVPDNTDIQIQYGFNNAIRNQSNNMGMDLGNPPDVAGWQAWYLAPSYNEIWINSATIPIRANFVKQIVSWGVRPLSGYDKFYLDPIKTAYISNDPSDINDLIPTLGNLLFPKAITESQLLELKEVLIPGLPDFEWTVEWNKYITNPNDTNQKKAVENSLKNLLTKMCSMAEYQLM